MTPVRSFINRFISLFLLLFHLGCISFPTTASSTTKKRRPPFPSPRSSNAKTRRNINIKAALSQYNPWSYLKPIIFSFKKPSTEVPPPPPSSSARSSQFSIPSPRTILSTPRHKRSPGFFSDFDISIAPPQPKRPSLFFSLGTDDIQPCPTCGEVFLKASHLELHQSTKHAVTELLDGDSSKNIVRIIFLSGWKGRGNRPPVIHRILKIHSSPKILARFEEYREAIKMRASRSGMGKRHERCIADGNELLRFHCSTFVCSLGHEGEGGICGQEWCSICGIIRSGFSPKLDGIPTMGSSGRAHEAIPEDMEMEFAFMKVRRAMLLCRVVAGRVASSASVRPDEEDEGGFDSVVVVGSGTHREGDELLVFSPRAVLPCFVIIYTA